MLRSSSREGGAAHTASSVLYYPELGGVLMLVSIAIVLNVLVFIQNLVVLRTAFLAEHWEPLTQPGGARYHPWNEAFLWFELISTVLLLLFTLIVAGFYFCKRRTAPRLVIVYLIVNLPVAALRLFLALQIPMLRVNDLQQAVGGLVLSVLSCMVWIPYFLFSRRVKGTFVH